MTGLLLSTAVSRDPLARSRASQDFVVGETRGGAGCLGLHRRGEIINTTQH